MDTRILSAFIRAELDRLIQRAKAEGDRGDAAEKVITIAAMVALALVVMGIIATKVTSKANGINF